VSLVRKQETNTYKLARGPALALVRLEICLRKLLVTLETPKPFDMFQIIWFILALADGRARKERRHERACFERDEEAGDVNSRTTTGNNGQIRVQQYMYTYEYVYSNARVVHNVLKNTHMSKESNIVLYICCCA
jgi:hypothetical protein